MTTDMLLREIVLRPVRDDDGAALAGLIAACFAEYEGCLYEPAEFPELAAPASWAAGRGTRLVVAEAEHGIIGCCASTPLAEQAAVEVHKVYLAAGHRGGGMAQRLIAGAFAHAQEVGATRLVLWSDTRFTRAHRFYGKLGFVQVPVTRYLADVSLTWEYRFERRLDGAA
jgi:putative acetyltransferase